MTQAGSDQQVGQAACPVPLAAPRAALRHSRASSGRESARIQWRRVRMCARRGVGMFSERTAERMKITHRGGLLGLATGYLFQTQPRRKVECRKGTLSNSELKILLCYWDE